jgi:hypothetical protein
VLEAVEIEEQHREHRTALLVLLDGVREMRREIEAVGEPGEVVVVRQVIELLMLLEQLRFGGVALGDCRAPRPPLPPARRA